MQMLGAVSVLVRDTVESLKVGVHQGSVLMICGTGLDFLQSSGEVPCSVCRTGVGSSSIVCNGCKHWMHRKCSGPKRLITDVYNARELHAPWTEDHRGKSKSDFTIWRW